MDRMAPEELAAGSSCWTRYRIARILLDKNDGDPAPCVIVVTTSEIFCCFHGLADCCVQLFYIDIWKPVIRQTNIKQQQEL